MKIDLIIESILNRYAELFAGTAVFIAHAGKQDNNSFTPVVSCRYKDGNSLVEWSSFNSDKSAQSHFLKEESSFNSGSSILHSFTIPEKQLIIIFEADNTLDEPVLLICRSAAGVIKTVSEFLSTGTEEKSDKYQHELINMRKMQAQLFPKFDNVKGLDIGTVYLPASLMSGNFIDAFYLDDDIFQITICDVAGYDAAASYAGAAIRTIIRSFSSKQTIPSVLIMEIDKRINKIISGLKSLLYITVCQINHKTGKIILSSFGNLYSIFYRASKKKHIFLNDTEIGRSLSKRVIFKDITINLEHNDAILFYSRGLIEASTSDGKAQYGEDRLLSNFINDKDLSSVEIALSVAETIYEFTNYSQINDDVILLCLKKKTDT